MTVWFTSAETTPKDTAPSEALARFVGNNFKPPAIFLDIGSGSGANFNYLSDLDFEVWTLDRAPEAKAHFPEDVNSFFARDSAGLRFDCIYDINTLCHVENPPYAAIYKSLKPGGKFFSIHPAVDTKVDMTGKGFTRLVSCLTMRQLLDPVWGHNYSIHGTVNWSGHTKISAWQIEATK